MEHLNRRDLLSNSFLAGLALTCGILNVTKLQAQEQIRVQTPKLSPKSVKIPQKRKAPIVSAPTSGSIPDTYKPIRERLLEINNETHSLIGQLSVENKDSGQAGILPRIEKMASIKIDRDSTSDFLPNNVEVLLDQASNLLDRAIRDRSEWDNLSVKQFYLQLEMNQFLEYDKIHVQETEKGYYDQLIEERVAALNIENMNRDKIEQLSKVFADMFEQRWNETEINNIANTQAEISRLSNEKNGASIKPLALSVEQYHFAVQLVYNFLQKEGLLTGLDQSKIRVKNLHEKLNWELVNRDFRKMRTDVERKFEYIKLVSYHEDDGILNYSKRLIPLKERFQNDFSEAISRLKVASVGLSSIFGFSEALPVNENEVSFFDQCVIWNRLAINWLIRFTRMDQSFSLPISLRSLLSLPSSTSQMQTKEQSGSGHDRWHQAIQSGKISFTVREDLFGDYSHIRLKGISLFVQMSSKRKRQNYDCLYNGLIQAEVSAPTTSYFKYTDGRKVPTDQSFAPAVKLNRISTRNFIRTPEIAGTSLLANLSPFGNWRITLPQFANGGLNELIDINDIYLDLFVSVRRNSLRSTL